MKSFQDVRDLRIRAERLKETLTDLGQGAAMRIIHDALGWVLDDPASTVECFVERMETQQMKGGPRCGS